MSGDVQPRKRKEKRRKKEGSVQEPVISQKYKRSDSEDLNIFDIPEHGEKIHVQNEHGIGGNICVKIIFFCLFGLLVGAVGLIYMQSQGSTDVDLPTIEESRFAEYFTGWLDDSTDDHDHEAHDSNTDHDKHDQHDEQDEQDEHEENEEEEEHDEHDEHDEEDHEEDNENTEQDPIFKLFGLQGDDIKDIEENEAKSEGATESESRNKQDVYEDEDDEQRNEVDNSEEEEEEDEEEKDEDETDNYGGDLDEQDNEDEVEDLSQIDEEEEEDNKHYFEIEESVKRTQISRTIENKGRVNEDDDNDDIDDTDDEVEEKELSEEDQLEEDDEIDKKDDLEENYDKEEKDKQHEDSAEKEEPISKTDTDDLGFDEIEVSEEDLGREDDVNGEQDEEQETIEDFRKMFDKAEAKNQKFKVESVIEKDGGEKEDADTEGRGVVVKLGVGIALIIVAHLVLVKKWKSMNNLPSDENLSSLEMPSEKKIVENLSAEPVRQTLVPENVTLNSETDEEEEEEEEEERGEDDEVYSSKGCEEFKKLRADNWETFEKNSWSIRKEEHEEERHVDNEEEIEYEEEEEEGEEDEDAEEVEDEQEEEEEEQEFDDEEEYQEEDGEDILKQRLLTAVPDIRQEEVKETAPTPPPRSRAGRGGQEVEEDMVDFQEVNQEINQNDLEVDNKVNGNTASEEEKAPDSKKVGNEDEWAFRQELDFADEQFENNPKVAVDVYDKIISKKPTLIRALIGRARALDHWAEREKSNAYLKQAINAYKKVLFNYGERLDENTYVKLAERCIERMRFAGNFVSAIDVHKALILKYPNTPKYRNGLAVTYLMLNKIPQAKVLLNETLSLWPDNGFALVHYGFILKTSDNNMEEGAKKLMAGIQTREEGVIDGMFFFHLGDALNRLGRETEAMRWYELGVKEGLFLSKYQRSLYNVNRLKGQPWWTKEETTYQDFFKKLEDNWREIRREGLELLNSRGVNLFKEEAENLKDTGDWKQLDLYFRGKKQANCNKAPVTCSLVSSFKPASTCTRGQIKFSVMLPKTHVWPHCGPTNCRLRSHLGLVVPKKTFIRVAEETRSWEEGKFIIFDDSFEHEVWHNGTGPRLVLIVDVWHPELTNHERRALSPI